MQSKLFTFIVGAEEQSFPVHSAVIGKISRPLTALMDGPMAEAQANVATLDDVRAEDFARFCQFAYTGDYTAPQARDLSINSETGMLAGTGPPHTPKKPSLTHKMRKSGKITTASRQLAVSHGTIIDLGDSSSDRVREHGSSPNFLDRFGASNPDITQAPKKFSGQLYCLQTPRLKYLTVCTPETLPWSKRNEDSTPVFLAHVRMYVLADKYAVCSLPALCLQKLHTTLKSFVPHRNQLNSITTLIREVYETTPDRDGELDALRELVLLYVNDENFAIGHSPLAKSPEFLELMAEGGDFARDMWKVVQSRSLD